MCSVQRGNKQTHTQDFLTFNSLSDFNEVTEYPFCVKRYISDEKMSCNQLQRQRLDHYDYNESDRKTEYIEKAFGPTSNKMEKYTINNDTTCNSFSDE